MPPPDKALDPPPKRPLQDDDGLSHTTDGRSVKKARTEQSKLLTLPDELLLRIAGYIDGWYFLETQSSKETGIYNSSYSDGDPVEVMIDIGRELANLACACKQLACIGREAMTKNVHLSRKNAHKFIRFLIRYPSLMEKVTRVHMFNIDQEKTTYCPFNPNLAARLSDLRFKGSRNADMNEMTALYKELQTYITDENEVLPVLLVLCSNLHEINADCLVPATDLLFEWCEPNGIWPTALQPLLLDQITKLNVMDCTAWYYDQNDIRYFELKTMRNLRSLAMPETDLSLFHQITEDNLPNLQELRLYFNVAQDRTDIDEPTISERDQMFIQRWFDILDVRNQFARLQSLKVCASEKFINCWLPFVCEREAANKMLRAWSKWENSEIDVQLFFLRPGSDEPIGQECYEYKDVRFRLRVLEKRIDELDAATENDEENTSKEAQKLLGQTVSEEWCDEPCGDEGQGQTAEFETTKR